MTNDSHTLSDSLKALREKNRWSQEELARLIHVSLSTVQRWETKDTRPSGLARRELKKLFRKYNIPGY